VEVAKGMVLLVVHLISVNGECLGTSILISAYAGFFFHVLIESRVKEKPKPEIGGSRLASLQVRYL
jgi:hypothetical protein